MVNRNRLSALFFLMFSLFVCQQSMVIGLGTLRHPGSGLVVFAAGAWVGILALVLLTQSRRIELQEEERTSEKGKVWLISLSLFGYAVAVNWLGFVLSTFVFVFIILRLIEFERWWLIGMKAALITFGNYLVFVVWLGLSLPKGVLSW